MFEEKTKWRFTKNIAKIGNSTSATSDDYAYSPFTAGNKKINLKPVDDVVINKCI
jgi:hypothetical protein